MNTNFSTVSEGIKRVDFQADKERADRIQQTKDELDPIRARLTSNHSLYLTNNSNRNWIGN